MDPRLQALIDRQDILDVLHQYVHGCDRSNEPRIAEVYLPGAMDNHGLFQGTGEELAKFVCDSNPQYTTMSHLLGQSTIHIDGDKAGAETYFNATIARMDGEVRIVDMMGGRYVDQLERHDDKWKISDRVCTCEWSYTMRVENEWQRGAGFVQGSFDKIDPSYAALGLA